MRQSTANSMKPTANADIRTLDDLRQFIHLELCRKENLLENHFPMTELELTRSGQCCGYQFILHGPRSVRLSAVWDRSGNVVLMYDVVGNRFAKVPLKRPVG